jgi:hypothetical protein
MHSFNRRRDVLLTALAGDYGWLDAGSGAVEHAISIGETKAKIIHNPEKA